MTMNVLYLFDGTINAKRSLTLNGGTIKNTAFKLATQFSKECTDVEYEELILVTGGKAA